KSSMSSPDHRTPLPALAGALAAAGLAAHALPALAAAWPPLRAPLGIEDRTASGRGFAITFDDGPHAQGSAAMLEILSSAQAQAAVEPLGPRLGGARHARDDRRARHSGRLGGLGAAAARRRRLLRRGLMAPHGGGAAADPRHRARARPSGRRPLSAATGATSA